MTNKGLLGGIWFCALLLAGAAGLIRCSSWNNPFAGEEISAEAAQGGIGFFSGTVRDCWDGNVRASMLVLLKDGDTAALGISDSAGRFFMGPIAAGEYDLRAAKAGFASQTRYSLSLVKDDTLKSQFVLSPATAPVSGTLHTEIISQTTSSVTFSVDAYALDDSSLFFANLRDSAFRILDDTFSSGAYYDFTRGSVNPLSTNGNSPFSAVLLLDQSALMMATDLRGTRIVAAKSFLTSMGPGDNALVAAFASQGNLPLETTFYGTEYLGAGTSFFTSLDSLSGREGGLPSTYASLLTAIDVVALTGPNANKAVVLFTSGSNLSLATADQAASRALSAGVRVYIVALSMDADFSGLSLIANRSGGAVHIASGGQLNTLAKGLSGILRGTVNYYRIQYGVNITNGSFTAGFNTYLVTSLPQRYATGSTYTYLSFCPVQIRP